MSPDFMNVVIFSSIVWNVSSEIFTLDIFGFKLPITWYGLFFASGFLIGQQILYYIFRKDGHTNRDVDTLTVYVVIATIIGARLGHYLFYEWELLFNAPLKWFVDLVSPPFAGLASHGATIAILIALYMYSRKKVDQSFLWVVDRVVIPVSLGGAMIRFGNLFNSEIYGKPTDLPWGFVFLKETDPSLLPLVSRHPTQLYEALFCLFLLALTFYLWKAKGHLLPEGFITGVFMVFLFSFRFLVEFLKNNQEGFEESMFLNMGQILSIPVVVTGMIILLWSWHHRGLRMKDQKVIGDKVS